MEFWPQGSMQQLYAEYSEIFISVKENTRRVPRFCAMSLKALFLCYDQDDQTELEFFVCARRTKQELFIFTYIYIYIHIYTYDTCMYMYTWL